MSVPMRLLLIAYEFPPSPSPQSLRWAYLTRELSARGHEVHVLAPDIAPYGSGLPELPPAIRVHRTYAGPVMGFLAANARRKTTVSAEPAAQGETPTKPLKSIELNWKGRLWTGLNWKGRLLQGIKVLWGFSLFPDIRAEWNPWARKALAKVLLEVRPDIVLASHEPAGSLVLGLEAKSRQWQLVADLGDPVLAPYTPRRWRARARQLEREVCRRADHVLVTSEKTRQTLADRHGLAMHRCTVVTQGFDGNNAGTCVAAEATAHDAPLVLLYTGSFYSFRRADGLLDAIAAVPGVRLDIASVQVPSSVAKFAHAHPEKVRLLGFLGHADAMRRQREADVLVNLANADPVQVPGKLYEYLGAGRPILHLGASGDDAAASLVQQLRRGWVCGTDGRAIAVMLGALVDRHRLRTLQHGLDMRLGQVHEFTWGRLAERIEAVLGTVATATATTPPLQRG